VKNGKKKMQVQYFFDSFSRIGNTMDGIDLRNILGPQKGKRNGRA